MEMPGLEEEATMSEPFYDGEWDSKPEDYWSWPGSENDNYDPSDVPAVPTHRIVSDELYDAVTEDDSFGAYEDGGTGYESEDDEWEL